jgi:hypothetical protein
MKKEPITPEIAKARCALGGVTLDESSVEDVALTMERALAPARTLDLRSMQMVEPAGVFSAAWSK